jgi:hypothetical protein
MSKTALITAFNDNFKKLTKTIHQLIPENTHLEAIKNAVHIGSRAKPDLYIKHFYEHVAVPFETQIITKDNQFFLNLDLSSISHLPSDQLDEANALKDKWTGFTTEQQDILWQYMIVLTKISQRWYNAS